MNKFYYGLRNILGSELLQKDTKCKIYKTLIRLMVLYDCMGWTLIKTDEAKLRILERFYGKFKAKVLSMGYEEYSIMMNCIACKKSQV
jgi:hypothetical protein